MHPCTPWRGGTALDTASRLPSPDDLLILLTVARLGRFTAVAETLGTTHTTISRRIIALEKQLGGRTLSRTPRGWELTALGAQAVRAAESIEESLGALRCALADNADPLAGVVRISTVDGFGSEFVTPALVKLQASHPNISVEMFSATRKVSQNRSGVDLEVVVGHADVRTAHAILLGHYVLRLYAAEGYLRRHGTPQVPADLARHCFVSYVESALLVEELGHRSTGLPDPRSSFQATSIFAQVEAVRREAGVGLLPNFMVAGRDGFVPVLADSFERRLTIWAVARPEALRSARVQAVIEAIHAEAAARQEHLDF
ncbi:LysR family transcriptional regulator [Arthrobacter koreensis]|uniref:LysR family transcriptional regulator n=1 Tax=Arthrobacter koreensis TaxID=199136 RepID=A0ABY6FTZ6_9MICC|nr:LysR family transcriptional regulator [Arthrobacter koreensis]MEB7448915.1 LysR family transcriptional regulator [Arthrobacter koreensis]UYB36696.1 LysR family transcriptional regulator [Arthrobacter koreensis]